VQSTQSALTHGSSGLVLGYLSVAIPMAVGLIRQQAPLSKLLSVPLYAIPAALVAAVAVAMLSTVLRALGVPSDGFLQLTFGFASFVAIGYASAYVVARSSTSDPSYRRGTVVMPGEAANWAHRLGKRRPRSGSATDPNAPLTLAGIRIAYEDETKHFKFIGTTGTGKSTAIREILSAALARGDRAVIADPDGGYLNNFYDPKRGDVILNPFAPGAMKWNPLEEITHAQDADQLACSLIPDNGDPDRTWTEHARAFFIAVAQQALRSGVKDDAELYRLLITVPVKELKTLLAGTPAGPLLEDGNERMFGSVRGTASSALRPLSYTTQQGAPSFSVRNWVKNGAATHAGGTGGALFIPYRAGEIASLRSLISAWMRIAIFQAMDRGEGDQRLWFVVDELDALGAIDGLKDALARLRKFGGRTIIGFQSIAQVSGTYGKAAADTIVENTGNTLILRCSASERGGTSEFASKLIGQREVLHTTQSTSRRPMEWFASTTESEHLKIEPAIMASEIERLPDLGGFLKFASIPDWMRVKLELARYPSVDVPLPEAATPASAAPMPPTVQPNVTEPPATEPSPSKTRAPMRKRARKYKQPDGPSKE
jgi:type IV secretory pathway TraG/TraD family ATPase VirD4